MSRICTPGSRPPLCRRRTFAACLTLPGSLTLRRSPPLRGGTFFCSGAAFGRTSLFSGRTRLRYTPFAFRHMLPPVSQIILSMHAVSFICCYLPTPHQIALDYFVPVGSGTASGHAAGSARRISGNVRCPGHCTVYHRGAGHYRSCHDRIIVADGVLHPDALLGAPAPPAPFPDVVPLLFGLKLLVPGVFVPL
jgi:hypothetical protein